MFCAALYFCEAKARGEIICEEEGEEEADERRRKGRRKKGLRRRKTKMRARTRTRANETAVRRGRTKHPSGHWQA